MFAVQPIHTLYMITLNIGDKAPAIKAKDEKGKIITLKQFLGKKVILYFYPEDVAAHAQRSYRPGE